MTASEYAAVDAISRSWMGRGVDSLEVFDYGSRLLLVASQPDDGPVLNIRISDIGRSYTPETGEVVWRPGRVDLAIFSDSTREAGPFLLPSALGQLQGLERLQLDARFTGPIPTSLGNLTQLTELRLEGGTLSGPIPSSLGNLTQLRSLVLSGNDLTGSIPASLGNLTRLQTLDLSGNALDGVIPASLGNLTRLDWLDLSSNALTGTFPASLGQMTALHTLNLAHNYLSGGDLGGLSPLAGLARIQLEGNLLADVVDSFVWETARDRLEAAGKIVTDEPLIRIGVISAVTGSDATVQRSGGRVERLEAGDEVYAGDLIVTGERSTVRSRFDDGALLTYGPNTRMSLMADLTDPAGGLPSFLGRLFDGALNFLRDAVTGPEANWSFRAGGASFGVRGTEFDLEVTPGEDPLDPDTGRVVITLRSGEISAFDFNSPGEPITLLPGDRRVFGQSPGDPPPGTLSLAGEAVMGRVLAADLTHLVDAAGLDMTSLRYQWTRNGEEIAGADEASYRPTQRDAGSVLAVEVSYRDLDGQARQATSPESSAVVVIPIVGTALAEVLSGGAGDDIIRGLEGNDTLEGGDGSDTLIGGDGADLILGGATDADLRDVIYGGDGNDTAYGGAGNDEIRGDAGSDLLFGDTGADTLIGGTGNDTLNGGSLGDVLFGGDGDDFLNGGFGYDRLNGGAGADTFFHLGVADHGSDWIQDYAAADGDVLQFGQAGAGRDQFQINIANTPSAGSADVAEAFVIYRPTGQIVWALVDGAGQDSINLRIGGEVFDLLA